MVGTRRFPALARAPASEEQLLALARAAHDLAEFWIGAVFLRADFRFSVMFRRSGDDGDRPVHRLVSGAAKNVAQERERTYLVGYET